MSDGWPHETSPYHTGEQAVQGRAGGREIAERVGRRVIRDHMPDQHREFFAGLTYAVLGTCDPGGQPWATVLTDPAGFLSAPDPRRLDVAARPSVTDPALRGLTPGAPVSLVGIDLATRRRNRLTGTVCHPGVEGFGIAVDLSFGNCPQYITARHPLAPPPDEPPRASRIDATDPRALALIAQADTCFLASATITRDGPEQGSDVNHRGGPSGFLAAGIEGGMLVVTLPDYAGNRAFSNFGNIALHPKAGLLVPDFTTGAALSLTGRAEILWSAADTGATGIERRLRIVATEVLRIEGLLPARWSSAEPAPQFARLALASP